MVNGRRKLNFSRAQLSFFHYNWHWVIIVTHAHENYGWMSPPSCNCYHCGHGASINAANIHMKIDTILHYLCAFTPLHGVLWKWNWKRFKSKTICPRSCAHVKGQRMSISARVRKNSKHSQFPRPTWQKYIFIALLRSHCKRTHALKAKDNC